MERRMSENKYIFLYGTLGLAAVAALGSLYFSEVLHFAPCVLCWYQRGFMYSIIPIAIVGIVENDKNVHRYILPLAVLGGIVSLFHTLLYYGIIPEAAAPCIQGVSCTTRYISWFGFISIPLLSLITFGLIIASMYYYKKQNQSSS